MFYNPSYVIVKPPTQFGPIHSSNQQVLYNYLYKFCYMLELTKTQEMKPFCILDYHEYNDKDIITGKNIMFFSSNYRIISGA